MTTAVDYDPNAPLTESEADAVLNSGEKERAPFGYKQDGTPRKSAGGRRPKQGSAPPKSAKTSATRPSGKTSSKAKSPDYTQGLVGVASILAFPLRFASPDDSAAVLVYAQPLAEAINETAKTRAEVAAMCDKLLTVGPYGAILSAALPMGARILANHNLIPEQAASALGAMSREDMHAAMGTMATEAAEQFANEQPEPAAA